MTIKIKYLSTNKKELCIVELPEGVKPELHGQCTPCNDIGLRHCAHPEECGNAKTFLTTGIELPPGNWSIIAPVKDITEEQAAGLCDTVPELKGVVPGDCWANYAELERYTNTAIESFSTLLQSIPIYTENPYGEDEPEAINYGEMELRTTEDMIAMFEDEHRQWTEAEQNVFRNSILLVNNETK